MIIQAGNFFIPYKPKSMSVACSCAISFLTWHVLQVRQGNPVCRPRRRLVINFKRIILPSCALSFGFLASRTRWEYSKGTQECLSSGTSPTIGQVTWLALRQSSWTKWLHELDCIWRGNPCATPQQERVDIACFTSSLNSERSNRISFTWIMRSPNIYPDYGDLRFASRFL